MENGNLMEVESIADVVNKSIHGAFYNTFDLHLTIIGIENHFWMFLFSGCLRQGLRYKCNNGTVVEFTAGVNNWYSVQLKNMYSYLNSSLKLSDIVRGLSCQQSYCNLLSLYKFIILIPFILSYKFFILSIHIMFSLILSDANDPQGLMRR